MATAFLPFCSCRRVAQAKAVTAMFKETKARSLAKAVSNRTINTAATILIVLFMTDEDPWKVILGIGIVDVITKFTLFYMNERIWDKLKFGKTEITPFVIWFTGLPYSGKSLLANALYDKLKKKGLTLQRLDGDDVRTLFPIEGFTREERNAYLMRMGYFANVLNNNGVFVLASFISPYEKSRAYNRKQIRNYLEVYVSTPQEVCEKWDEWGTYEKARRGEIEHFVGVQEPFEVPKNPNITIDLSKTTVQESLPQILKHLPKALQ